MKVEAHISQMGWLNITVTPETTAESGGWDQLVPNQFPNPSPVLSRKSSRQPMHTDAAGKPDAVMVCYVTLQTKRERVRRTRL